MVVDWCRGEDLIESVSGKPRDRRESFELSKVRIGDWKRPREDFRAPQKNAPHLCDARARVERILANVKKREKSTRRRSFRFGPAIAREGNRMLVVKRHYDASFVFEPIVGCGPPCHRVQRFTEILALEFGEKYGRGERLET